MRTYSKEEWKVSLGDFHPEYRTVLLRRPDAEYKDYEVVMVDSSKLMAFTENGPHSMVIAPVAQWTPKKRNVIFSFLRPPGSVPMPKVSFIKQDAFIKVRKWFVFTSNRPTTQYLVSYAEGRHRARYLHDAGATCFPVLCHKSEAAALIRHCGSPSS